MVLGSSYFKTLLLICCLLIGSNSHALEDKDSVTLSFMPQIVAATSDSQKIDVMLQYAKVLRSIDPEEAKSVFQKVYQQSRVTGNEKGICESLIAIATMAYQSGDMNVSDSLFNLVLSDKKRKPKYLFSSYAGIANSYTIRGDYEVAAENYYKALTQSEKDTAIKFAHIYSNLYVVWFNIGDKDKAIYYLDKSEKQAILEGDSIKLGNALNLKANYYLDKDPKKAYQLYESALLITKNTKDSLTELFVSTNLANLDIDAGRIDQAHYYMNICTRILEKASIKDVFQKLSAKYYLGICHFKLKEYDKAEALWLEGIQEAEQLNANLYKVKPYLALAELYSLEGDHQKANTYYWLYSNLSDNLINEENIKAINLHDQQYKKTQIEKNELTNKLFQVKFSAAIERKNRTILYLLIIGVIIASFLLISFLNMKIKFKLQKENLLLVKKEAQLNRLKVVSDSKEVERKRIAGDLHDGVGSLLSVAKMNTSLLSGIFPGLKEDYSFATAIKLLDHSAKNIRLTSHCLQPEILLKGGIDEAMHILCECNSEVFNTKIDFQSYGHTPEIDADYEKVIYKIVQDLLMNAMQDSDATSIMLQFNWQDDYLFVTFDLNGHPINRENASDEWKSIRTRLKAINSILEIHGENNIGTVIDVEISLNNFPNNLRT